MEILAKTMKGLEGVLASEIKAIGGKKITLHNRAVGYSGDREVLYRSNIQLRTALRILVPKKEFRAQNEDDLYKVIYNIPWEGIMNLTDTFAIDSTANSEIFTHSKYIALKTKDAIADRFVDKFGKRPNVNTHSPTYRLNIHVREDVFSLSLDSSGSSLHMRGYRMNTVPAPINEVMAAGILKLSNWDPKTPFVDPMCGSGTLLIEAAKMALNLPPQTKDRIFTFQKWKSFDKELYEKIWMDIESKKTNTPISIKGFDKSLRAVKVTEQNIEEAGLSDQISVEKKNFFKLEPMTNVTLITNPPYDERLKEGNIRNFYKKMGEKFISDVKESKCWFFSGNIEAMESITLQALEEYDLLNASIPAKLVCYET